MKRGGGVKSLRMRDPLGHYEMLANGHPKFLTKSSRRKVLEANLEQAASFGCFESASSRKPVHVSESDVADVRVAAGLDDGGATSMAERQRRRRRIQRNPDSKAAQLLRSGAAGLPEDGDDWEDGKGGSGGGSISRGVVTLRVRSLRKGLALPEFAEGGIVVGIGEMEDAEEEEDDDGSGNGEEDDDGDDGEDALKQLEQQAGSRRSRRKGSRKTKGKRGKRGGEEEDEETPTCTRVFRILSVFWGIKAYVHMMVDGGGSSAVQSSGAGADRNCFLVCQLVRESFL